MFTGIIEDIGVVTSINKVEGNLKIKLKSSFADKLKTDQSVSHNGVCLTVEDVEGGKYSVTAIEETLSKTNLGLLKKGSAVNLERSIRAGDPLDGHFVLGHIDQTGICKAVTKKNGSWLCTFEYDAGKGNLTVEKGSICINGVSLTVINSRDIEFSVAIIPYTFEHTNFHSLKSGDMVNLEFDIIGKYVKKLCGSSNYTET